MSLQELALQNSPQMNGINNLISTIKAAQNPAAMIQQLVMNNQQAKQAKEIADQYGGWEQAARAVAQQKGIDINLVLKQLSGEYK